MLRIECPVCGLRDESEFVYGGDATVSHPPESESDPASWTDSVFIRENPRGMHCEWWQHIHGCRQWLTADRDTQTHKFHTVRLTRDGRECI